ncbi:MAG: hypothetical protein AB7P40_25375 [Chloroflexota bacterium]
MSMSEVSSVVSRRLRVTRRGVLGLAAASVLVLSACQATVPPANTPLPTPALKPTTPPSASPAASPGASPAASPAASPSASPSPSPAAR